MSYANRSTAPVDVQIRLDDWTRHADALVEAMPTLLQPLAFGAPLAPGARRAAWYGLTEHEWTALRVALESLGIAYDWIDYGQAEPRWLAREPQRA